MRKYIFALTFLTTLGLFSISSAPKGAALTGGDFQAGRIMDDSVFFNPSTIDPQTIQFFLNSKVPTCDTNGTQPYAGTTRASYGTSRGYPPPYICLRDYVQDTPTRLAESGLCNQYNGGTKTAAQIIYDVGQACGVNPKVLIILLEKEQSLVTDDWPWSIQYRSATGYGCPDTAPCDAEYYGFFNQVYMAARQFKRYGRDSTSFRYRAYRENYVQFNPNTACGGSNVYIQNQATAGLYNYTPYQPNYAALANLYGTGDSCSAYGNRNFWRMYNDWFGGTNGSNYSWSLVTQQAFTDASKTTPSATSNLAPGQKVYAVITVRNNGIVPWYKGGPNPVRLGTSRPFERKSNFCDATWLSCSRPAALTQNQVDPGQNGTFEFWLSPPTQGGSSNEYFTPVVEGIQWMPDIGLYYSVSAQAVTYTWQMTSQSAYTDQTKATPKNMSSLMPGEKVYVGFKAKNTGNVTWKNSGANAMMVGTYAPMERASRFSSGSSWLTATRPTLLQEATVAPGQSGTFEFWMTAPVIPGTGGVYNERFGLIANGITWLNDTGLSYYASVAQPSYTWQMTSQYAYTDQTKATPKNLANFAPAEKAYVGFTAKNTGNTTWANNGPNALMVGTYAPMERASRFSSGSSWLTATRPTLLREVTVAPGQTGTFEFWITAPAGQNGVYNERFGLIANGITWFNDTGLSYYTNVR